MFYVYIHTVPNGKIYIGETKSPIQRWSNGEGYEDNDKFYRDIQKYGWNSIKHELIGEFRSEQDALVCEGILIAMLNSESDEVGYNKTKLKENALKMYASRKRIDGISLEKNVAGKNILELSGLPISACEELINQWIFSDKNRRIIYDRLINGMTHTELSKKYGISVRQIKNIVYECSDILSEHIIA